MTSLRRMVAHDLLRFNTVCLDQLTETYSNDFYCYYFNNWPQYQYIAEDSNGFMQGLMIVKAEGQDHEWHAHVSAVSVAPESRRIGLGAQLMECLENIATKVDRAYFIDLFVRKSNEVAINMYKQFGYIIFRTVTGYYQGPPLNEDGIDMRKALERDKELPVSSLVCNKPIITPSELQWQ
ncbi:putative N-acetyltransferase complex ARD1 subunit [Diplonema papillatum]|nr:putative N-acetyltransferase complex ARD1 subunit [Diplonema papillatum]